MTQLTRSNEFIRVTSNGGYLGGFWWVNSGTIGDYPDFDYWGAVTLIPVNLWGLGWAGELWIIRVFTKN